MLENQGIDIVGDVVVTQEQIAAFVSQTAKQVENAYRGQKNILAIVLMKGAKRFADDLFANMQADNFEIQYVKVDSYNGSTKSSGKTIISSKEEIKPAGRTVLIIDDIYDTGLTLKSVINWLGENGAGDIKTCVLLNKEVESRYPVRIDFGGMKVPNLFLVGYGLDYKGKLRELPFVAQLNEEEALAAGSE